MYKTISSKAKSTLTYCGVPCAMPFSAKRWKIGPDDFESLRTEGCSDEAIFDAIAYCALFNFYNRWVSSNGVCQMPDEGIAASGKRIAQTGYLRTDVPRSSVIAPDSVGTSNKEAARRG